MYTTRFKDREGNIKTLKLMVDGIECNYKQIIKEGSGAALQKTIEGAFGDMKFNVIIGNPPFQESTGDGTQARAIYNEFVEKSIQMSPDYIAMIIPSKWFGGGMGLNSFRTMMMNNKHIEKYVHYFDAKECFENVKIAGGVGYFLYNRGYNGMCNFTNIMSNNRNTLNRYLSDYKFVLANNSSVCIIDKVISKKEPSMAKIASPISLFGLPTTAEYSTMQAKEDDLMLYTGGNIGYISNDAVTKGREYVGSYCAMVGAATSGSADQYENIKVFTLVDIKRPGEVSTQAYIMIGKWDNEETAANCVTYLKTKFCRFLLQAALSSIHISADKFCFVPMQDFTKPWTDAELYKKYNLTKEEIGFIESTIRPME